MSALFRSVSWIWDGREVQRNIGSLARHVVKKWLSLELEIDNECWGIQELY